MGMGTSKLTKPLAEQHYTNPNGYSSMYGGGSSGSYGSQGEA